MRRHSRSRMSPRSTTGSVTSLPEINVGFVLYATIGGLAQAIAAALLVALFSHRNFFVGTALSRTETIQASVR